MEEQRQRQEDEARRAKEASSVEGGVKSEPIKEEPSEEALLERALAMSMEQDGEQAATTNQGAVDFANMTEEEQIAFAMQMSMQDARKFLLINFVFKIELSINKLKGIDLLHFEDDFLLLEITRTSF